MSEAGCQFHGANVSRHTAGAWQVESFGRGVYLFRWNKGFYLSPFVVADDGVTAFDPISATPQWSIARRSRQSPIAR